MHYIRSLVGERAVGTDWNNQIIRVMKKIMENAGCETSTSTFSCLLWSSKSSWCESGKQRLEVHPSPFSLACHGTYPALPLDSPEALFDADITGKAVIIHGSLAREPLMPKDFPFFYPEEHRRINDFLESRRPAAVISCTGRHPFSGVSPYPLFEDGAIQLASGSVSESHLRELQASPELSVSITSKRIPSKSAQLTGLKSGSGDKKILLCAHMDTKYDTPGVLDNAAGVSVMLRVMDLLQDVKLEHSIEYVPFNGEEYFSAPGQMAYLAQNPAAETDISLVINVDGCGHRGSQSAFSFYNLGEPAEAHLRQMITEKEHCRIGSQWIQGDHAPFAFRGIPCTAVTSSDLTESVMEFTHTEYDTLDKVDTELLDQTAGTIAELIQEFDKL